MFGKLITLLFLVVTANAFSLRSANDEKASDEGRIDYRLPTNVVPIHYDLKIESNIAAGDFNFAGETTTKIEVLEPTNEIVLNSKNLTLNESQTRLVNKKGESLTPKDQRYDDEREMLTLVFPNVLPAGIYTLHLRFSGVLATDLRGFYSSFYINENGDKTWLAVTHFQPVTARKAFPCWDEPALKATFNVSVKHHSNYTALSNMPAYEQSPSEESGDGKIWTHFEKTPIMSTHIVAFVISDFEKLSVLDGKATVWARKSILPNLVYFLESARKVSDELERYMNRSVGVPKMDHVAVPAYSSRATENWGLIVYDENAIVYYPNETTMFEKDRIVLLAGHELAHQWISNLVGPQWWDYLWMSEGFAAYYEFYIMSKVVKDSRMMDIFPLQIVNEVAFRVDTCPFGNPMNRNVSSPDEIYSVYSHITYRKASTVLRMLSHCISDEVFHAGLLKYLQANQYKTAVPDDLWRSMQEALDQSNVPHEGYTIKEVMDTWTQQIGYPVIFVERDNDTGVIRVRQETSRNPGLCNNKWWVPLNFATQENPDFSSTRPTHWLSPTENVKTIEELPKDGWIMANIQQTGYYRVQYDLENWKKLAQYLNSDNYKNIHLLNRVQVFNEAFSAMFTNELSYEIFGMMAGYLARETDPLPWMVTYYWCEEVDLLFDVPESSAIIKPYIRNLLSNNLKTMDYKDYPEDERWTRIMKRIIKDLACMSDVPECYGNATAQLIEYLDNPDSINIHPDSQKWVFCYGLRKANQSTWNRLLDLYVKRNERSHLHYLACSENKTILENFLNMTLSDDSPLTMEDNMHLCDAIVMKKSVIGHDALVDFLGNHLAELRSKSDRSEDLVNFLSGRITTKEQLKKMIAIYASMGSSPDTMIERFEMRKSYIEEIIPHLQELVKATKLTG